ncbi:ABC transporter ATP-binding protein [Streptomyces sp. NPDC102364]|uniref:ABC transporter ATP-binding protein n=1 Tax=Streptomyces sp. NPDC102364 TaxID=3366161 RepID=UPI00381B6B5B
MLEVTGLRKLYEGSGRQVEALRDLTFRLDAGELVCVVGPSGCGKTTLLKCVAGLLRPTEGSVALDGAPVTGPRPGLAVVFQEYGRSLFPWMRVAENVELPLRQRKSMPKAARRARVAESLEAVGLAGVHRAYPWELSGGMQQRVAIARALAYEPEVLLMDEPFAAVDAQTRADLEDLVRGLWRERDMTVLFITHDIDEAVYLGERVLVLSASPTVVLEDVPVELPVERDQLTTRADARFTALRSRVLELIRAGGGASGSASGAAGSDAAGGGTVTDGESGEEIDGRGPQDQVANSPSKPSNPKSPR